MSFWEFGVCVDGFNEANSAPDDRGGAFPPPPSVEDFRRATGRA